MYIVYEMHREEEYMGGSSWVGNTYIIETYEKAVVFWDMLNKLEKNIEISHEFLDTDDAIQVDTVDFDKKNNEIIINPGKEK